jgi:hypothetical protein
MLRRARPERSFVDPDAREVAALRLETVRLAVELGVDVSAVDPDGRTAAEMTRDQAVRDFLATQAN